MIHIIYRGIALLARIPISASLILPRSCRHPFQTTIPPMVRHLTSPVDLLWVVGGFVGKRRFGIRSRRLIFLHSAPVPVFPKPALYRHCVSQHISKS
jgi:hypothetical protein